MRLQAHTASLPFSLTGDDNVSVHEEGTLPGGPVLQLSERDWRDASETNDHYGFKAVIRHFPVSFWSLTLVANFLGIPAAESSVT